MVGNGNTDSMTVVTTGRWPTNDVSRRPYRYVAGNNNNRYAMTESGIGVVTARDGSLVVI